MQYVEDFFDFCRRREWMRERKDKKWPWSDDFVLQHFRIGNIFREDDTTTSWFREAIRNPLANTPERLVLACVAVRWFSFIPCGKILLPYLMGEWNERQIEFALSALQQTAGSVSFITPKGKPRISAILQMIRPFVTAGPNLGRRAEETGFDLRHLQQELVAFPNMGPYLAYEVVSDLRHTCVLDQAQDIDLWAQASPMSHRGLSWVFSDCESEFLYGHDRSRRILLSHMRELLALSRDTHFWPFDRQWEMREVETALRGFNTYRVAQCGGQAPLKYQIS